MTWYDQPTGGTVVGTGGTFITPMLNTTTVYYVEASNGTCTSPRVPVQAIIETQPAVPVITDAIICGPGSAILLATSPVQVTWYDQATGGTALSTGSSFQTPVLSATTTYYAEAGVACRSNRVPATVTILTAAVIPVGQDASTCGAGSVVLSATSTDPMSWYDAAVGGNLLGSGASYTTGVIKPKPLASLNHFTIPVAMLHASLKNGGCPPKKCISIRACLLNPKSKPKI